MAGRPANPSYTIPAWAPNTNYPISADPWSATPTKTTHPGAASVGFTPKTGVPAQCVNKLVADAYTTDGSAKASLDAWATFIGQVQALNFGAAVGSIGTLNGATYDPVNRYWWVFGPSRNVQRSGGQDGFAGYAGGLGGVSTDVYHGIAFDASGNAVAVGVNVSGDAIANSYTASANTWAGPAVLVSGAVNTGSGDQVQIAFDPTSGLFCAFYRLFASPFAKVFTSPNRTTWTARTAPANFGTGNAKYQMASNGAGLLVASGNDVAGTISIATSADGGVTWAAQSNLTSTVSTNAKCPPVYNAYTGTWMLTMPGTSTGEVWTSSDGAAWTKVATLASSNVFGIAPSGNMWCGLAASNSMNHVAVSLDQGVTWQFTGYTVSGTPLKIVAEPLGLGLVTTDTFAPGLRAGLPLVSLT